MASLPFRTDVPTRHLEFEGSADMKSTAPRTFKPTHLPPLLETQQGPGFSGQPRQSTPSLPPTSDSYPPRNSSMRAIQLKPDCPQQLLLHQSTKASSRMIEVPLQPVNRYTTNKGRPMGYPTALPRSRYEQIIIDAESQDGPRLRIREVSPTRTDRSASFPSPVLHYNTVDVEGHPKVMKMKLSDQFLDVGYRHTGLTSKEAAEYDEFSPPFAPSVRPFILEETQSFSMESQNRILIRPTKPIGRTVTFIDPVKDRDTSRRLTEDEVRDLKKKHSMEMMPRALPLVRPRASEPDFSKAKASQPSKPGYRIAPSQKRSFTTTQKSSPSTSSSHDVNPHNHAYTAPFDHQMTNSKLHQDFEEALARKQTLITKYQPSHPSNSTLPPRNLRRPSDYIDLTLPDSPKKLPIDTPYPPLRGPGVFFPQPLQIKKEQPIARTYDSDEEQRERIAVGWNPSPIDLPVLHADGRKPKPVVLLERETSGPALKKKKSFWGFFSNKEKDDSKFSEKTDFKEQERGKAKRENKDKAGETHAELRARLIEEAKRERAEKAERARMNQKPKHCPIPVKGCDYYGNFER
jgi:hypothetical protein